MLPYVLDPEMVNNVDVPASCCMVLVAVGTVVDRSMLLLRDNGAGRALSHLH